MPIEVAEQGPEHLSQAEGHQGALEEVLALVVEVAEEEAPQDRGRDIKYKFTRFHSVIY